MTKEVESLPHKVKRFILAYVRDGATTINRCTERHSVVTKA